MARPGTVGFLSQSGALCTAILDWSLRVNVGFSAFVSIGSMLDVGWGDLIDYLGDDPDTKSIVIYMESIGDARSFLSAAREVALTKPIIVIKAGRTEAAAKAAASHTGSLAGSDEVLDAAFRRVGVLRVDTISEVFDMAEVLAKQPRPRGPAAGDRHQRRRARRAGHRRPDRERRRARRALPDDACAALDAFLPPPGATPTRSTSWATPTPTRYAQALEVAAKDPDSDGLLVDPDAAGDDRPDRDRPRALRSYAKSPASRCWRAGWAATTVEAGEAILDQRRHPHLRLPRHRRPGLHAHVAVALQPPGALRDPDPARRRRDDRRRPRTSRARSSRPRAPRAGRS